MTQTPELRIFSYLPNPRIWKSTITARINGVQLEVVGARPPELGQWLWDVDARPLSEVSEEDRRRYTRTARTGFSGELYKTDAFMRAHPYGTVPAAFSPDGTIGVFESNSIMRAVARLGETRPEGARAGLYGDSPWQAARIDGFLDTALVFARDSQIYLLAIGNRSVTAQIHAAAAAGLTAWLGGIEAALGDSPFIAGSALSLADICFVCELALFSRERMAGEALAAAGCTPILDDASAWPRAMAHFERLCAHEAFAPDVADYVAKLKRRTGSAG